MPIYTYYDYLENYYDNYYEYYYWPYYYGVYNGSNSTYNGTYPPSPYKPPWDMKLFNPIMFSIAVICCILSVAILLFALYKLYHFRKINRFKTSKTTIALTIACLTIHTLQNTLDPISFVAWYLAFDVDGIHSELYMAWDVVWCLSKVSLYLVFMWRYFAIFQAASMMRRGSKVRKYIMFGLFMAAIVIQMVLILMYMLFYYEELTGAFGDSDRTYLDVTWAFLVGDILLIAVLGYLLTRSIFKLIVQVDANRNSVIFGAGSLDHGSIDVKSGTDPTERSEPSGNASKMEKDLAGYMQSTSMHPSAASVSDVNDRATVMSSSSPSVTETVSKDEKETKKKVKKKKKSRSKKQEELIFTTTRLVVTCVISLTSSVVYQLIWLLAEELEHRDLWLISYTWTIDAVINMFCVYLSMGMAQKEYQLLCVNGCKCHRCALCCIYRLIDYKAIQVRKEKEQIQASVEKELEMTVR
eukprot:61837_1